MDQIQILQQALDTLEPELPALVSNDWPAFARKLEGGRAQLAAVSDPDQARAIKTQILLLFFDHPQADARLSEVLTQMIGANPATLSLVYERGLMGDIIQPSARYHCPGDGAPHWLREEEVVRNLAGLAFCSEHPQIRVTAELSGGSR